MYTICTHTSSFFSCMLTKSQHYDSIYRIISLMGISKAIYLKIHSVCCLQTTLKYKATWKQSRHDMLATDNFFQFPPQWAEGGKEKAEQRQKYSLYRKENHVKYSSITTCVLHWNHHDYNGLTKQGISATVIRHLYSPSETTTCFGFDKEIIYFLKNPKINSQNPQNTFKWHIYWCGGFYV